MHTSPRYRRVRSSPAPGAPNDRFVRRVRSRSGLGESGFTLVELLISMVILAVVMVAVAGAFYQLMFASSASRQRSVADGLAVTASEQVRSFPYWLVGYSDVSSTDTTPTYCSGGTHVTVPYSTANSPMNNMSTSQTVSGVAYQIQPCAYWITASDSSQDAYKETVVTVLWGPNFKYHYALSSAVYPGAEGQYTTGGEQNFAPGQSGGSGASGPLPTPVANRAAPVAGSTSTIEVDWQPVSYSALVQYRIEYWQGSKPTQPSYVDVGNGASDGTGGIVGTVTGLSPSTSSTPSTYSFDVVALSGLNYSSPSNSVSASTNSTTSTTCTVTGINAVPKSPVIDHQGQPMGWSYITVTVSQSGCNNLTVYYGILGSNGSPTPPLSQVALSGSYTSGSLNGNASQSSWSASTYGFVVYSNGSPTSAGANVTPCVEQGSTGHC